MDAMKSVFVAVLLFVICISHVAHADCPQLATANTKFHEEKALLDRLGTFERDATKDLCNPDVNSLRQEIRSLAVELKSLVASAQNNKSCLVPSGDLPALGRIIELSTRDITTCQTAQTHPCRMIDNKVACSPTAASNNSGDTKPPPSGPQNTEKTDLPKTVSCTHNSDITGTGTNSIPPASVPHCQGGNTFLKAARNNRQADKPQAARQYRRAAQEFQLAGDDAQAQAALREAQQVEDVANAPAQHPMSSEVKNPNAEGEHQESLAKRIEQGAYEDQSCDDLEVAADYYDSAMDDFLGSGDFDRAAANLMSEIRVRYLVARLRKEAKCEHKYARNQQSPHSMPPGCSATLNCDGPPPAKCKAAIEQLKMLAKQVGMPDDASTTTNGRPMAPKALTAEQMMIKVKRVELAGDGCPRQKDEPELACADAAAEWRRDGKDEDYINASLGAAGCPFKRWK